MEYDLETNNENRQSSDASTTEGVVTTLPLAILPPGNDIEPTQQEEHLPCRMFVSPNSTMYWIPICSEELRPSEKKVYETMEEAIKAYLDYAYKAGFDVRHGAIVKEPGLIKLKYLYCNKAGYKNYNNTKNMRNRLSGRVGCTARIIIKHFQGQGFVVTKLEEKHTHSLVDELGKMYMKRNRQMRTHHRKFVLDCAKQGVGTARSYRLFQEMVGGYNNVGPLAIDFKNQRRDLLAYFKGSDAQVVIDRFFNKQETCSAFYFAYDLDEEDKLNRLFWTDAVSRKNYSLFGDIVSFDSTYNTNRYKMVFSPFTGYDHHKGCVLFGAGLLRNENVESYVWLFEHFKKAMGRCPTIFSTDQDPAMKIAVEKVFPETRHRLCMWHIMEKLSQKIDNAMTGYSTFTTRLRSIVWNMEITPEEFESEWKKLMDDFGMANHLWLSEMFLIREKWIPAYYRNVQLGGLVRTTSISESMNNFFRKFSNFSANLIEFILYYDSAIETQRYRQGKNNYDCAILKPKLISPLPLEKHASTLYTLGIWKKFQEELSAALYNCRVTNVTEIEDIEVYTLKQQNRMMYTVEHTIANHHCSCSCNLFIRNGYPCRHILEVLKDLQVEKLPETLTLTRWTKAATLSNVFMLDNSVVRQSREKEEQKLMLTNILAEFHSCVDIIKGNREQIKHFTDTLRKAKQELLISATNSESSSNSKTSIFDEFAGVRRTENVTIHDPTQAKTKGSGKRLKSGKEVSMETQKRGKRLCSVCNQYAPHNRRTCPEKKK